MTQAHVDVIGSDRAIRRFDGNYRFLSNFYPASVTLDGQIYPTVEHAYQAAKTLGSVLIWLLALLLCVFVVNGWAANNQSTPDSWDDGISLKSVTKGCPIRFGTNPICIFDQSVGDEFSVFEPIPLIGRLATYYGHRSRGVVQTPNRNGLAFIRWKEGFLPVPSSIVGRNREIVVRANHAIKFRSFTIYDVGWRLAVIENLELEGTNTPYPSTFRLIDSNFFADYFNHYPRSLSVDEGIGAFLGGTSTSSGVYNRASQMRGLTFHAEALSFDGLQGSHSSTNARDADKHEKPCENDVGYVPAIRPYRHGGQFGDTYGFLCIAWASWIGAAFALWGSARLAWRGWPDWIATGFIGVGLVLVFTGLSSLIVGCLPWYWWTCLHDGQEHGQRDNRHNRNSVTQKHLTTRYLCNTVSGMANVLSADKQTAIIAALAEGSSIRSIERITGVHRDTIMRLGVKVGKGCEVLMDSKMQDLDCHYLQFDELWGFIGKKERHVGIDDNPELGDVWTFCAIDSETKLVPSFLCGKRNHVTANAFVQDVASRMRNRVQISTDALNAYVEAVEQGFGADVDYGQIVKVYVHDAAQHPERKYSAPSFASAVRRPISGDPERELISTSHVERLNATTRLHVKRLNRLTLAFSKKLENFKAAVALHFAYYNFVRRHATLRCTPAMAAGIEKDFWTVGQLVEATV